MRPAIAVLLCALTFVPAAARADDYGSARAIGGVRSDALRLLARQVRASGVDPKNVEISDVVVSGDQALLSWAFAKHRGLMGLVRQDDRWWDALDARLDGDCWYFASAYPLGGAQPSFPADYTGSDFEPPPDVEALTTQGLSRDLAAMAAAHNADVRAGTQAVKNATHNGLFHPIGCQASIYTVKPDVTVHPQGATIAPPRFQTSGYAVTIAYARNDATSAQFKQVYFRPPTPAEFLPNHALAPGWGYANAVCYFDIAIAGTKPVTIGPGTVIDLWFPFVLDDQLEYSVNFVSNGTPTGLVKGTVFDNTVHFVLPEFTLVPGSPLMAEVDGDPKPSH